MNRYNPLHQHQQQQQQHQQQQQQHQQQQHQHQHQQQQQHQHQHQQQQQHQHQQHQQQQQQQQPSTPSTNTNSTQAIASTSLVYPSLPQSIHPRHHSIRLNSRASIISTASSSSSAAPAAAASPPSSHHSHHQQPQLPSAEQAPLSPPSLLSPPPPPPPLRSSSANGRLPQLPIPSSTQPRLTSPIRTTPASSSQPQQLANLHLHHHRHSIDKPSPPYYTPQSFYGNTQPEPINHPPPRIPPSHPSSFSHHRHHPTPSQDLPPSFSPNFLNPDRDRHSHSIQHDPNHQHQRHHPSNHEEKLPPLANQLDHRQSYSGVLEIRMPSPSCPPCDRALLIGQLSSPQPLIEFNRQVLPDHHHHQLSIEPNLMIQNLNQAAPIPPLKQPPQSPQKQSRHTPPHPRRRSRPRRVYENHPGNLLFCCSGRLVSSRPSLFIPFGRSTPSNQVNLQLPSSTSLSHSTTSTARSTRRPRGIYLPLQTICSVLLLIGIPALFIYSTAPTLVNNSSIAGEIVLAIFCYIWMISISSMIKTITSDPGILPRGLDPNPQMRWRPASNDLTNGNLVPSRPQPRPPKIPPRFSGAGTNSKLGKDQEKQTNDGLDVGEWELTPRWVKVETRNSKKKKDKDKGMINNHHQLHSLSRHQNSQHSKLDEELNFADDHQDVGWVRSKWCTTCQSYRPPRSSHCRICDCCIDGIDHHCSYLNNCIGSRNYRSFFTFLAASCLDLIIIIGASIWRLLFKFENLPTSSNNDQAHKILNNLRSNPINIVVVSISILLLIPISALLGYHVFLTVNGLTTVEYIKSQTTKKVIKENKKLINQFLLPASEISNQPNNSGAGGTMKRNTRGGLSCFNKVLGGLICINHPQDHPDEDQHQQLDDDDPRNYNHPFNSSSNSNGNNNLYSSSNHQFFNQKPYNFTLGRLCKPDTETYIDWHSFI